MEKSDRLVVHLLSVVLLGYIAFQVYRGTFGLEAWIKIAGAFLASAILGYVLGKPAGTTRIVRWCTLLLVSVAVFGGFALEFGPR